VRGARFAPVREVFAKSFESGEVGAAVSVTPESAIVRPPDAGLGFAYVMNQMQTGLGGDGAASP
jgi:hypothetical protein